MKSLQKELLNQIQHDRFYFMGFAMMFVILCHANILFGTNFSFLKIFALGYGGCDIFLFFSSFGLCYSLKKYKITEFYKRRFLRIVPYYWFMAICVTLIISVSRDVSFFDFFCNISTLAFHGFGDEGAMFEWFLSSLILIYLFFPLLFHISKGMNLVVLLLLNVGLSFLLAFVELQQYYYIFARVPAILLGIKFFQLIECDGLGGGFLNSFGKILFIYLFLLVLNLSLARIFHNVQSYVMLVDCSMIFVVFLLCYFKLEKLDTIARFIGKHSLWFYIGNTLVCDYYVYIGDRTKIHGIFIYFLSNMMLSLFLIYFDDHIVKRIKVIKR